LNPRTFPDGVLNDWNRSVMSDANRLTFRVACTAPRRQHDDAPSRRGERRPTGDPTWLCTCIARNEEHHPPSCELVQSRASLLFELGHRVDIVFQGGNAGRVQRPSDP
jgi:hypothetical protein